MTKTGIRMAVEALSNGSDIDNCRRMGLKIGVSYQAVQGWLEKGYVPVGRARQISRASGVDHRLLVDPVIRDLFEPPRTPRAAYPPQHPDGDEGL